MPAELESNETGPAAAVDTDACTREARLAHLMVDLIDSDGQQDAFEVLDRMLHALVAMVSAAGAGLMLLDGRGRPGLVACTDESARHLELYQLQRCDGPCLEAIESGEPVVLHELASEARWPEFARGAASRGFGAVLAVPMRAEAAVVGSVNVFFQAPQVAAEATRGAQTLVDAAALAIATRQRLQAAATLADQLTHALQSRVAIEQAKGVLAEHYGLGVEEAFGMLRGYARARRTALVAAAEALVSREITADEVGAASTPHP
jgi:GAF domain-containing protein